MRTIVPKNTKMEVGLAMIIVEDLIVRELVVTIRIIVIS